MKKSLEIQPPTQDSKPVELKVLSYGVQNIEVKTSEDIDPRTIEKSGYLNIGRMLSRESVENGWVNQYVRAKNQ